MTHLTITIEIPVDCKGNPLEGFEAQHAANEAYKAARKALSYWTQYSKDDFAFKITT